MSLGAVVGGEADKELSLAYQLQEALQPLAQFCIQARITNRPAQSTALPFCPHSHRREGDVLNFFDISLKHDYFV